MKHVSHRSLGIISLIAALVLPTATVLAAAPTLSTGQALDGQSPYANVQSLSDIYGNHSFYGMVKGDTPVDILSFTPSEDGQQTISLMVNPNTPTSDQPGLVLIDPTTATASNWSIPTPSADYHAYLLKQVTPSGTFSEPYLFQSFTVLASDHLTLQKGKTYYLDVIGTKSAPVNYIIRFGDGTSWTARDVFTHFGSWLRVKTSTYAGQNLFAFKPTTVGMLIFLLGFAVLLGAWLLQQVFSFLANRAKMAGYILIKMQPYTRIFTWVALWFTAIGGYIYFEKAGWVGPQFVIALLFILMAIVELVYTFTLSRRLDGLEVHKQEATITLELRRWLFGYFVLSFLIYGSFLSLLSIYLIKA